MEDPRRRAAAGAPRADAHRMARCGPADPLPCRDALPQRAVGRPAAHEQHPPRGRADLHPRAPPQRPGLLAQLLPAAGRRPGHGDDGGLPAIDAKRPHHRLCHRHLQPAKPADHPGQQEPAAHPGSVLHRAGRHAPGPAGRLLARHAHVHGAAAAGPAGQHPGAAHGQLAPRAQRIPQRAHGPGDADVHRPGVRGRRAGARQPPTPARRARSGRCAGLSQGHGGLAGHGPARARSAGPHQLCEPGLLQHGGLHGRGTAGTEHCALLAARARRDLRAPARQPPVRQRPAAARGP